MSTGLIAVGVAGGVLLLVTLADIFVAVFNYDGFTFLTARVSTALGYSGKNQESSHLPGDRAG